MRILYILLSRPFSAVSIARLNYLSRISLATSHHSQHHSIMSSMQQLKEASRLIGQGETILHDKAKSDNTIGLPTPDSTPSPDDEEVNQIAKAKIEEAQSKVKSIQAEELNRVLSCPEDAYDDILSVKQDEKEQEKDRIRAENWVLLGCLLNPKVNTSYQAAFESEKQ